MTNHPTSAGRKVISELLDKFPNAASNTIARIAVRDHSACFTSLENARLMVRRLRGNQGEKNRKHCVRGRHDRPCQASGDPFGKIPKGITNFKNWGAIRIPGPLKAAILPDAHIPYHHPKACSIALQTAKESGIDTVLFNGDTLDCFALSHWEKDPTQRDFPNELKTLHQFFAVVRDAFPSARIIFKIGNHEERYERYMFLKAPELLHVPEFDFKSILHCDKYGIELVGEKRPIQLGKLFVIHGHEYRFAISNPVNPARGFYLRAKVHCLGSHMHRTSQHSESNMEGKIISTWSTGCLSDLHPDYRPLNDWNHGFAIVAIDKAGAFQVENYKIINDKAYHA